MIEQSDFERRTAWAEEHDRKRDERDEVRRQEHREWAQGVSDQAYAIQVEILSELKAIHLELVHLNGRRK